MAKPKADNDDGQPSHGSNVPNGEALLSFIERFENLDDDIAKEKTASKLVIDAIKEDQDTLLTEAGKAGFRRAALKNQIKKRATERKLLALAAKLKGPDGDAYEAMNLALEKLGPLGQAALKAA